MAVWLLLMDVQLEDTLELLESLSPLRSVRPRAPGFGSASAPFFKNTCATIAFSPVTIFRENRIAHWFQAQLSLNCRIYV